MDILILLPALLAVAAANYFFTGWFIRYAKSKKITDVPTERSSHEVPTPRGGGVGFVLFTVFSFSAYLIFIDAVFTADFLFFLTASLMIAILGWYDDKKDLSKRVRFGVQLIASLIVILGISGFDFFHLPFIGTLEMGLAGGLLALFWLTGTTNSYNFMDGVDGIASVQALGAAAGWIMFSIIWDLEQILVLNAILAAAVIAFLVYNWSPAKIFMGDVGSVFLGFVFAAMPLLAADLSSGVSTADTAWIGGILLWPFLFDSTYTIFRRLSREENIFEAHRSHLYQRLNIMGWSHQAIALLYLSFSALCMFFSYLFYTGDEWLKLSVLVLLTLLSFLYVYAVYKLEKKKS